MRTEYAAYLGYLRLVGRSPRTVERYEEILRDLETFTGGAAPSAVGRDAIRRFVLAPRQKGASRAPAGSNLRLTVARGLFRYLREEEGATADPSAGIRSARLPRRTPKALSPRETALLEAHVGTDHGPFALRNHALFVLAWQRGLRVSEIAGLTAGQFAREDRLLRDVERKGGHKLELELNEETTVAIAAYLATRGEVEPSAPLFASRSGGHLSVRAIEAIFEVWRAKLGWTRSLSPHILRHTFATDLLEDGADPAVVAELLDHADLRTVLLYARTRSPARREALRRLGARVHRNPAGAAPSSVTSASLSTCAEWKLDAAA